MKRNLQRQIMSLFMIAAVAASASGNVSTGAAAPDGIDPLFSTRMRGMQIHTDPIRSVYATTRQDSIGKVLTSQDSSSDSFAYDPEHTNIHWSRLATVAGGTAVLVGGLHIYQRNAWWNGSRASFHIQADPDYAKNVDKAGHLFGGAFSSFVAIKGLEWSGIAAEPSVLIGSSIGTLFELYVEFEDGFHKDWGFSPGDAEGDIIGGLFPIVQYYIPFFRPWQLQFQYVPSRELLNGKHKGSIFIDDYDGQTMWLAFHIAEYMPAEWKRYWPEWLGLAIGVSIRDKYKAEQANDLRLLDRNFLIALDYDWTKILPGDSWFMQTLKQALNYLHFPSPAIRFSPDYVAYGLYFW